MCEYYPLIGKLLYGKIFLIIFDQPFIAQLILPNMKEKTVKIIQLLGNSSQPDLTSTVGKYMPNSCVK